MDHIENYWKETTSASNELFQKGAFEQALTGYEAALYRAEVLNNHIKDCLRLKIPFIQVYIISCNNLANTYKELGQKEEAENMLQRAVYYLLYLSDNILLDRDEIQSELHRAVLVYTGFLEKTTDGSKKLKHFFSMLKEQLTEKRLITTD